MFDHAGAWTLLEFVLNFLVDHEYPSGGSVFNLVNWVKPVHRPGSSMSPSTFQMSLTFVQHIECRICPPDEVNKFQGDLEGVFFRHMEFYSLLNLLVMMMMMMMNRTPRNTSEVVSCFQVILCLLLFL